MKRTFVGVLIPTITLMAGLLVPAQAAPRSAVAAQVAPTARAQAVATPQQVAVVHTQAQLHKFVAALRATYVPGYGCVFQDASYSGANILCFSVDTLNQQYGESSLDAYNLDDAISSLYVGATSSANKCQMTIYNLRNYGGIYHFYPGGNAGPWNAPYSSVDLYGFVRDAHLGDTLFNDGSFANDRVSSFHETCSHA